MSNPEECEGTGIYGDNGPGMAGNREWVICDYCGRQKAEDNALEHYANQKLQAVADEVEGLKGRRAGTEE